MEENGMTDKQFNGFLRFIISDLESIREKGIIKGNRQYVHLSKDIETARNVGKRHGEVVILPIDIEGLKKIGKKFGY